MRRASASGTRQFAVDATSKFPKRSMLPRGSLTAPWVFGPGRRRPALHRCSLPWAPPLGAVAMRRARGLRSVARLRCELQLHRVLSSALVSSPPCPRAGSRSAPAAQGDVVRVPRSIALIRSVRTRRHPRGNVLRDVGGEMGHVSCPKNPAGIAGDNSSPLATLLCRPMRRRGWRPQLRHRWHNEPDPRPIGPLFLHRFRLQNAVCC